MNKTQLVNTLVEKTNLEKSAVEKILEAFEEVVIHELKADREVALTGFGTFSARHRSARTGVNPQHPSEKIEIPAMTVPKFKAGKSFKDALKN